MAIERRHLLTGLAGVLGAATLTGGERTLLAQPTAPAARPSATGGFPRKADFAIADGVTYINGAFAHPMPQVAADAYRASVSRRSRVGETFVPTVDPRPAFAALINATPAEIGLIPNTSSGENLVFEALDLKIGRDNVVTDGLHFEGSLVHLMERKKQGLDVRVAMPRDGRIHLADLEKVIDKRTRLVEVSHVAMYNGFQHDLKAVCDLAHAHGALVYADIIQAAGAVPIDVRAIGVDFAATSTYKWLMGDFGLGFLYVKASLLDRLRRPHWSYESAAEVDFHWSPTDPESPKPIAYTPGRDTGTFTRLGTIASGVAFALAESLPYIQALGVANIQAHRVPLLRKLQQEMPRLGFTPQTPAESTSPIVTFAHNDYDRLTSRLAAAKIDVRLARHWIRISPSVYNDMRDIDRLLDALS